MRNVAFAAAGLALAGVAVTGQDPALAKGPQEIAGANPLLVPVKETQYNDIDFKDFPWDLEEGRNENVRMTFTQKIPEGDGEPGTIEYVVIMPWLEVEKDGEADVTVTFPETQSALVSVIPAYSETFSFPIEFNSEDSVVTFKRDGDRMSFTGGMESFSATVDLPEQLSEMDFSYTLNGGAMKMSGNAAAEQDFQNLETLDMAYDYTVASLDFALKMVPPPEEQDMPPIAVKGTTGSMTASGKVGEGVVISAGTMNDLVLNILQPMPMDISVGKMRTNMEMPSEASPEPQKIHYLIEAEKVDIDESLWSMVDPGKAFPRELNKLTIDVGMMAMIFVSIFDTEAMAEAENSGMPTPLMPTGVTINSIAFDGLGLLVDAAGQGELKEGVPEAAGQLSVTGLMQFVENGMKVGMFGEQEAMMVQGMAQQFGKPGGENELIFEIETKDGMIVVNGTPVAPLPQ